MTKMSSAEVIFYIPSLASGGAERQCAYLASAMRSQYGVGCSIIVTRCKPISEINREKIVKAGVVLYEFAWFKPWSLIKMLLFLRKHRRAALFCYLTFPGFFGCLLARAVGLRNCYGGVRCSKLPTRFLIMELFTHLFLSRKTIFNSYCGRDNFVKKHFRITKCCVISNMISPAMYTKQYLCMNAGKVRIITVGRFTWEKDYRTFIKAIRELMDEQLDIDPVIIGYGEMEKDIKQWISQEKLDGVIKILDGKDGTNIPLELAKADIYLSTSVYEGTSNSIMEAMNAGLPVVATNVGDNALLVDEGKSGFICKSGDMDELVSKIRILVCNPDLRREFGEMGKLKMQKEHSVDAITEQYMSLVSILN